MKNKKWLLAELTLLQEKGLKALDHEESKVTLAAQEVLAIASRAIECIEERYAGAAKVLGNFAQSLKNHWGKSPSLYSTIDGELKNALMALYEVDGVSFPAPDTVRVIIEDGKTKTSRMIETNKLKIFYICQQTPQVMELSRNSTEVEEFALYSVMKRRCEMLDEEKDGFFAALYEDIERTPPRITELDDLQGA